MEKEVIKFTLDITQVTPREGATAAGHMHAFLARLPVQNWQLLSALALLLRGSAPTTREQEDEVLWLKVRVPGVKPLVRVRLWVETVFVADPADEGGCYGQGKVQP